MEEIARPGAIILQYANPMVQLPGARKARVRSSACHGVQTTLTLISGYCDVPKDEITFTCGGINHMDWFLKLEHRGRDLYPTLREVFERPEYYKNEKVRGEVFRHFGYFMTESTGHLSEYVPWFRKNRKALDLYCDEPGFGGETALLQLVPHGRAEVRPRRPALLRVHRHERRSVEYCSHILEAVITGRPFRLMGNVRNDGYITNLPNGCVEVHFRRRYGPAPHRHRQLPPQCAASHDQCQRADLAADAALHADPPGAGHGDGPADVLGCTLDEIRRMTAEMLEAERPWLPQFGGELPRRGPSSASRRTASRWTSC
jgi:alpha-galactosidase